MDHIFKRDDREYARDHGGESFISAVEKSIKQNNKGPAVSSTSDAFILTKLKKAADAKGDELKEKFKANSSSCTNPMDQDLEAPYQEATKFANSNFPKYPDYSEDLQKIRNHVYKAHEKYSEALPKHKAGSKQRYTPAYVAGARVFAEPVADLVFITPNQAEELKASFAYVEYHDNISFQLAFRKLCEIKARKTPGGIAACTREIDEMRAIPGSHIRAVERSYSFEDSDDE